MATDPTQLHHLSLLLQSKRRDAQRRRGERCREKGRVRGEMHREGDGGCSSVQGMQHQLSLLLQSRRRDAQRRGGVAALMCRECREQSLSFRFRVIKSILFIVFFLRVGLVEPVGSVQSVLDFKNRNRTEPVFFVIF